MYVCMYVCMYVYTYICIYIYIYCNWVSNWCGLHSYSKSNTHHKRLVQDGSMSPGLSELPNLPFGRLLICLDLKWSGSFWKTAIDGRPRPSRVDPATHSKHRALAMAARRFTHPPDLQCSLSLSLSVQGLTLLCAHVDRWNPLWWIC